MLKNLDIFADNNNKLAFSVTHSIFSIASFALSIIYEKATIEFQHGENKTKTYVSMLLYAIGMVRST